MSGGVSDVHGRIATIRTAGVHIKSGPGRGGNVRKFRTDHLNVENAYFGIMIDVDTGSCCR